MDVIGMFMDGRHTLLILVGCFNDVLVMSSGCFKDVLAMLW